MCQLPYFCHICGWRNIEPPWNESGSSLSLDACPCCGYEFASQDFSASSVTAKRERWLATGGVWLDPSYRPANWNINAQIANLNFSSRFPETILSIGHNANLTG